MKITVGSKVKHTPTGNIMIVEKVGRKLLSVEVVGREFPENLTMVDIADCVPYVEPPKEKSFYEIMREKNLEDAKKLPVSPKEVGQHILWLKAAAIERIENIDKRLGDEVYTFRAHDGKEISINEAIKLNDGYKFGFSEQYLNLMMHYAYESGKKNATDTLTRHFEVTTRDMKTAMDSIIKALDDNGLLPYGEDCC